MTSMYVIAGGLLVVTLVSCNLAGVPLSQADSSSGQSPTSAAVADAGSDQPDDSLALQSSGAADSVDTVDDTSIAGAGGWQTIGDGLASQTLVADDSGFLSLSAVRIDPARYQFRVHYMPGQALSLGQWRDVLPDADVIINGNFFTPELTALGLVVSDGVASGQSYTDRGGTFAVQGGQLRIWSNRVGQPDPVPIVQAVQAFPMLVQGSQAAFSDTNQNRVTRRSAIGIDTDGHVVLMATPGLGPGLYDLSQLLADTSRHDMNLVDAFNLDGGGSTMLYVAATQYRINSFDPVPVVLAVYARDS